MKKLIICTIIGIVSICGIIELHSCKNDKFNPYGKYYGYNGTYSGILVINENGDWTVSWIDEGGQQTISGKYHDGDKRLFGQGTVYIPGIGYQDSGYTEYGEFVGNDIRSGGWSFKKEIQFKQVGENDVKYLHVFNHHVRIVITTNKNNVTGLEFVMDNEGSLWDVNGERCGEIKFSNNSARVSGIKGASGKYVKGDYTYETGPIIGE